MGADLASGGGGGLSRLRGLWGLLIADLEAVLLAPLVPMGRRARLRLEGAGRVLEEAGAPARLARGMRIDIVLAEGLVLAREVVLPRSAERHLAAVLGHELARHFPFAPSACRFGHAVIARDEDAQTIRVRILAVPLRDLEPALAAIDRAGAVIGRLWAGEGKAAILLADGGPPPPPPCPTALDRWLAGLAALALIAGLVLPPLQDALLLEALARRIAALETLEQDEEAELVAAISARAPAAPSASLLLEALTRALPDEAYVRRLELAGSRLDLEGAAPSAGALVARLEAVPGVREVRFASPIEPDPVLGIERFRFELVLEGRGP